MTVGRMKFIVRNYIAHIARKKFSDTIVNDLSRIFCWVCDVFLRSAQIDAALLAVRRELLADGAWF